MIWLLIAVHQATRNMKINLFRKNTKTIPPNIGLFSKITYFAKLSAFYIVKCNSVHKSTESAHHNVGLAKFSTKTTGCFIKAEKWILT